MRTLILADVHGNLAALEAVLAEPHDQVLCLGDLVGSGPEPAACVARIRTANAIGVQGNHDRAVAEHLGSGGPEPFRSLAEATRAIAEGQLDDAALGYLRALPSRRSVSLDDRRYLLVHATPQDPWSRALGPDTAAWTAELAGVDADTVLVGHTHVPFDLAVGERRVVNPGSVGLPLDGDPRAAYAVLESGAITLRRVSYPIERTVGALQRAGLPATVIVELAYWVCTGQAPLRHDPLPAFPEAGPAPDERTIL
jgi:putative phosphoesterase